MAQGPNQPVPADKFIQYIRDRYKIPDTVKMSMTDLRVSEFPAFYTTTITVDDGKNKQSQALFVSRDMAYLIEGQIFKTEALYEPEAHEKIVRCIRDHFNVPDSAKITLADMHDTVYKDFYATLITVDDGKSKKARPFYVTKDMRYLVQGNISHLGIDPPSEVRRLISLADEPSQGPATAPVTLVEYSDLACPHCARLQHELETEILPKYGDKLRIVYKEFPLINLHGWVVTGAVAAQCTYQIDPSKYVDFRTLVFKNQDSITNENARDMLLHFGAEAGVDGMKLAACVDSSDTLPRVQANMLEGDSLGIGETPTSYINGRILVGDQAATEFYKLIDEVMHAGK
jgi:protein-disulfide isomerase